MSPVLSPNDHGDRALRNAVVLTEVHLSDAACGVPAPDLADLLPGQLGEVTALTGTTVGGSPLLRHVRDVVLLGSEEQMGRVDAGTDVAPMAHEQARPDGADVMFVRPSVSAHLARTYSEGAVPVREAGSGPHPATTVVDAVLRSETFDRFGSGDSHRIEKGTI